MRRVGERGCERVNARRQSAVAVGTIDGSYPTWASLSQWPVLDIPPLLSITSGTQTGAAWVELRSRDGALACRLHGSFLRPVYHAGLEVLDEKALGRTGVLLSRALKSEHLTASWFRVVLKHLGELSTLDGSLERQLWHLIQVFECYFQHEGIGAEDLLNSLEAPVRPEVKTAVERAARLIEDLAARYGPSTAQLRQIAQRVRSSCQKERAFGLQIAELLRRRMFPDRNVVNGFYAITPRKDGIQCFEDLITKYRGEVVHRAYFDFLSGSLDVWDVYTVVRHLHDIALRLAFGYLGYQDVYRSPINPAVPDRPYNWVTSSTPGTDLGYQV